LELAEEKEENRPNNSKRRPKWFYKMLQDAKPDDMEHRERRTKPRSPYNGNLALTSEIANSHDHVSFEEDSKKQEWE